MSTNIPAEQLDRVAIVTLSEQCEDLRDQLRRLADLAKRTLQHQQHYFRAGPGREKEKLLRECKDYERRLMAAAEAAIAGKAAVGEFETPPLPGMEGL